MDITSEKEILGNDDNNLEPKVEIEEIEIKTIGSDNSDNIHTSDVRSITSKNFYEEPLKFNTENTNTIELLAYNYNDNRTKDVVSPTQKSSCIPHNGKLVKNIICSPNLKYIATFSEDDNSIVGWLHLENNGTLEPETFYDGSQRNGFIACIETLSDEKYIVFESNQSQSNFANEYSNNKFIKLLNNQKKPFNFERPTFLTNGDLFVISYENDQIYLFSLDPNEEVITCKAAYNISLPKLTASDNVAKYFIISNSYLLINNGDTMASQWDLTKMEFEFQYFSEILLPNNYYRYNSNAAIFNKDKSLLAVYLYVEKQLIIYSIQYGINKCDDMAFIYTKDNTEHLFVVLQNEYADIANNYILMDPYNLDNYTDINHYDKESGYLKLKLKVEKLTLSFVDEYDYFELCTHFLINCKVLENDDLLLITRLGIMIFSSNFIAKKIYLKYFWNDYIEQEKYWMRHTSNSYYIKKRISEVFSFAHALFIQLRPEENYDLDTPILNSDNNNPWNIVSRYYQIFSNGSFVDNSFIIQQPEINTNMFAEFSTSMLAMYKFLTGDNSALSSISYEHDAYLTLLMVTFSFLIVVYLLNLFIVEEIHQKIRSIDKNKDKREYPPIISDKLRELVGIPVQKYKKDLSKQYEEIKNEFKNLQVNHAELKNQFDELKKELIKQFDINSKFMTYQLKEGNQHIIENILNQLLPQNRK
ncbi:13047_t:CDS:2 [Entrophospora sp. SA101]|nr:13047_t:CDS:2 [Entrophospora sp. SA101]